MTGMVRLPKKMPTLIKLKKKLFKTTSNPTYHLFTFFTYPPNVKSLN